ncbi:MAG: PKD domain-containing protein, partial [Flavobacteriales bacterium]|nr:PKD domain-containing protein [Flavobacteriales bacterium]
WLFGQNNSTPESGLDIYKNTITQYYQAGIVLVNQKRPKVRGNFVYVTPSNPIGNIFHIDIEDILDGAVVTGNRVGGVQGGFGINIVNVDANPSNPSLVANNMVYMGSTINPTYSEGIALQDVSNIRVVFNTVYTSSTTPETGALRLFMGASNGIELYNNNVVNAGAGLAINAESPYYISASDHNNLYAPSGNIGKLGTNTYNTLANWQSGSGFDNASLSVDPNFAGYDLHTCRAELDGAGIPIASITNDFDGDSRDVNHPDIGADEFISVSDFSLGPDIVKCPNDTVILSAPLMAGTTYNWSPFFQNTPSIEATVPATYFVQVVSSCGLAIDTVIVSDFPNPTASFTSTTSFFTAIFTNNSSNGSSYLWDFGDGHTSTDVNPTHVYDNEGSFTVTLTVTNDCGSTSTTAQTVVISVPHNSIEDENAQKLSVYPNPTDAISRISFEFTGSEMVYLSVIDLSGKTIWMHNMGIYQGSFSTNINFSTYSAGTYLV